MATRRPRILTGRLIVVAVVLGVVLAVVSVPVGAVVGAFPQMSAVMHQRAGHFYRDGQIVVFERRWSPVSERWSSYSAPRSIDTQVLSRFDPARVPLVARDPRPAIARTDMDGTVRSLVHYRAGWPWRSAGGVTTTFPLPPGGPFEGVWRPSALGRDWTVPYLPYWPGLLANITFYTLLVLASVVLWRWLRLRRRARRNLCLACGYELGAGVGVCPECGLAREG